MKLIDPTTLSKSDLGKIYIFAYHDKDRIGRLCEVPETHPGLITMNTTVGFKSFHNRQMSEVYELAWIDRVICWLKGCRV